MKKGLLALLLVVPALVFTGCEKQAKYKVGICQLAPHPALDAATQGFKDELEKQLGKGVVAFDEQNAAGEANTCTTIVNSFVSKNVNLIMANATPALQAAANATLTIPILGTSITEYGVALGIENFSGVTGMNISGTSDLASRLDDFFRLKPSSQCFYNTVYATLRFLLSVAILGFH